MGAEQWVNIAVGVAVIGFLWNLHRDIAGLHRGVAGLHTGIAGLHDQFADLRERMARLEGSVKGFIGAPIRGRRQNPCQRPWAGAAGAAEPVR